MSDSRTNPTSASALRQYDDYILDVVSAPDICGANLVTNDNVAITMGVHIHDRFGFAALDTYRIHLDTDSNPATGAPADASLLAGAEFVIDVARRRVDPQRLERIVVRARRAAAADPDRVDRRLRPGTPDRAVGAR